MKIAITGSSGLLGEATIAALEERGDAVVRVRRSPGPGIKWTTEGGFDPADALAGFDAVVHLAGENVAAGRWTAARKKRIRESRVLGTRSVVAALEAADPRPSVLVCATGTGLYGDRGDEICDEDAGAGDDFLAEVCVAWEAEAERARTLGVRTVLLRTAPVLSTKGGALAKLLPLFRFGLGGRLGDGRQWFPWIHVDDWVRVALKAIDDHTMTGAFNAVAPTPVTNRQLTQALGRSLRRPTFMTVPKTMLRLGVGELAETLLGGQRAVPSRLSASGFEFRFARLEDALEDLL